MTPDTHPAFEHLRSQTIEALKLRVEEYRHKKTGAQHIHLAADNPENVFLVALRTVPHDSTGVAHVLEHTALCGSEKYPVRDPFFMMIRRSLNTFMNAFTSSDWTAYPFASQNRKDFDNLLDVYLDAVFFSNLDELDFAQEGHRLEFAEPDNPDSKLVHKGVVYNEMKGAMSSVPAQLWQALSRHLYPSTTYHHNSGGDPEHIPDLTYEQLKAFYRTHYHPSNAIFMTYGDISAADHQAVFEARVLSRFEPLDTVTAVGEEKRYHAPIAVEQAYPLEEGEDPARKTHVVMSWLLGKSTNLQEALEAELLTAILLDNSASPLLQALETTELGQAPSPLCGLDDSHYEMAFACGLEGCALEQVPQVEQLILDTLRKVAEEGVPQELVESALHQLELEQREVTGDGMPYGLHLIMTGLGAATHRGDPIALLDQETALTRLREKIHQPDFIPNLVRTLLLENPHRLRLTLRPDTAYTRHAQEDEERRLEAIRTGLSDERRQEIIERARALEERQNAKVDDSLLPKVGLEDIPHAMAYVDGSRETLDPQDSNSYPLRRYSAGTNGLVYQQLNCKLPALSEEQQALLPYYCHCLTELGVGERDYLETQRWQASAVGAISASSSVRGATDDVQRIDAYLTLSAKALARNHNAMTELMKATLEQVRFDELPRLRELIAQTRARREQSITGSGHSLAMAAATAGMAPAAKLSHQLGGLAGIAKLKQLDQGLEDAEQLARFSQQLQAIHRLVLQAPKQFLLVGEPEQLDRYRDELLAHWPETPKGEDFSAFTLEPVSEQVREAWITNTQVNFCAKAYPTVPGEHPDSAALTVLGGFLRNGYLHRAIREQGGAYGGGASQDGNSAAFRFFSYRDPRLTETLDDFDGALEWLHSEDHGWQPVEEAILGVISSIDKPASPAGEAKQTYQAELFGRTREKREMFRNRVLEVTLDDLRRVADQYLKPEHASIAVVTHSGHKSTAQELGLNIRAL
ncbi:insulinase family protein [Marinimicrobium sp. ABcell2]|uniref:insulinase family protein n=1 Tax=Marinimicrobium sp. ABcell2 TaxID=3069751 RepID=UPI0027B2AF2F|nr:insulinase family protein [Marinimicrobium sp. ABcell2]MDQ2075615.1 insulinase family protein [Marinimicrobium sp. ABcell2]